MFMRVLTPSHLLCDMGALSVKNGISDRPEFRGGSHPCPLAEFSLRRAEEATGAQGRFHILLEGEEAEEL